jgi:hypothetical protein
MVLSAGNLSVLLETCQAEAGASTDAVAGVKTMRSIALAPLVIDNTPAGWFRVHRCLVMDQNMMGGMYATYRTRPE